MELQILVYQEQMKKWAICSFGNDKEESSGRSCRESLLNINTRMEEIHGTKSRQLPAAGEAALAAKVRQI
jgi:hypothetical protein